MPPDIWFAQSPFAQSLVPRLTDFASAWLLTYLVHSTVVLIVAWIVTSRTRVSESVREVIWKCALVGGIVTATLQTAVAREPLGGQLRLASRTAPPPAALRVSLRGDLPTSSEPRIMLARPRGVQWSAALVIVWLTGSGAGLLWLTIAHARTLRVLADRTPLDATPMATRLAALLDRARVRKRVELTCSGSIASPVALSGDEVCLPRRALFELAPNEQDGMLAHEVAHLVRRDPQWLVAARAIETVLFMQPLNRLARHRMQETAEFLCDDWAVSRMSQPVTLAKCLAAVAEWVGRAPRTQVARLHPMSAMVESGGSPLVRRVGRILASGAKPRAQSVRVAFALSACALVVLGATAPRVSVAHPVARRGGMTFVRAIATDSVSGRDSVIVFRTQRARVIVDSLVRRSRVAAGPRSATPNARVRTFTIEAIEGDSANVIVVGRRPDR